ncbi:hypothetical protein LQW54_007703 [Pestalotiopsis sp. IQ-011]
MPPPSPSDRICVGCRAEGSKYKCPRCMAYTKKHKEDHPAEEEKKAEPAPRKRSIDDANAEQPRDDELDALFEKFPQLAGYLNEIGDAVEWTPDNSDNLDRDGNPRKKPRHSKPLTPEMRAMNGVRKLRQLRDHDATGCLREYGALVSMRNAQKAQEEARKKDAQRIAQLIREEKRD